MRSWLIKSKFHEMNARYELVEWSNESWIELALNNHIDLNCHLKFDGQTEKPCEWNPSKFHPLVHCFVTHSRSRWKLSEPTFQVMTISPHTKRQWQKRTPYTVYRSTIAINNRMEYKGRARMYSSLDTEWIRLGKRKVIFQMTFAQFFVSICHSYFPNASSA